MMSDYTVSRILPTDKRAVRQMDALLEKEGIERDKNLDYSIGLFDDNYDLVATGSCFANTLRCMAVSSEHQGEGLMNQIISHLIEFQYSRGNTSLFLYTKCNTARFFGDLGFYEIARVEGKVVFMENRRTGFSDYLKRLQRETSAFLESEKEQDAKIGAGRIMNIAGFFPSCTKLRKSGKSVCSELFRFLRCAPRKTKPGLSCLIFCLC